MRASAAAALAFGGRAEATAACDQPVRPKRALWHESSRSAGPLEDRFNPRTVFLEALAAVEGGLKNANLRGELTLRISRRKTLAS